MRIEPEKSSVSIVMIGKLNPAIFHPAWFLANNLLNQSEYEDARIEIILNQIAIFKVGEWLDVRVEPNRFIAVTTEPPFVRISDLVCRTFGEALVHTPITRMGINRAVHFSVGDEGTRDKIGKMLAPQEAWGEWASDIAGKDPKKHGGMNTLSMQQIDLADREAGFITAKVQPSNFIKNLCGIEMNVNDDYQLLNKESLNGAILMTEILSKHFDDSIRRSEWIIDQIMALKDKI